MISNNTVDNNNNNNNNSNNKNNNNNQKISFYDSITEVGPEEFIKCLIGSNNNNTDLKPIKLLETCLSTLKSNQVTIETCSNDFIKLESEYIKSLDSEELETLLFKESQDLISRITNDPFVKIAFCGATNAGKTTLLMTLLDRLPLPNASGHTTARICVIRYSELENANLHYCRLNTETSKLDRIPDSQVISLSQYPTTRSLRDVLFQHLSRDNMPKGEAQFEEAVSQIVVIEYPITLLKGGEEIYDIPGQSSTDLECLKQLRQSFLQHINPHGVVFCFPNPAFSTEEIKAYEDLLQSLRTDVELRSASRTFFANTKFDSFSLSYDLNLTLDEMMVNAVPDEEQARSNNLPRRAQQLDTSEANKEVAFKDYTYSLVNTMEYLEGSGDAIFHRFIERLATWIVSQQQRRYATAYKHIAEASNSFFRSYNTIRSKEIGNILKETWLKNGNEALDSLRTNLLSRMDDILQRTAQHFEDFLVEHDLYNKALAKAKSIVDTNYEGLSRYNASAYAEVFKLRFSPWFNENVLKAFIDSIQRRIDSAVEESMKVVFDRTDSIENELLLDVLQQSFVSGFNSRISNDSISYKNITPTILSNLLMTATKHPMLLALVIISVVGIIPTVISVIVAPIMDAIRKIDDDFKVELTDNVFFKIREQVKKLPVTMRTIQTQTISDTIDSIKGNLAARQEQLRLMYEKLDSLRNMAEMRTKFGRVEAEALYALTNLMDPSYIPVITNTDEDIGGGATGRVYKGTLKEKPVAIKTLSYRKPIGEAYEIAECMFFEEVNNSYQLTNKIGSSRYLLPLLGVFNDETRMEWQIAYPLYDCDLFHYLHRRITNGNIITWSETLSIAIDVASCIQLLHDNSIIHRDLKLENIFVNYSKDTWKITHISLGDYGTITFDRVAMSYVGSDRYMAPEIRTGYTVPNSIYTDSVDIYSLSGILFELIPKNKFQRAKIGYFNTDQHIKDAPEQYRKLIMDCANNDPDLRPKISDVKSILSSIVL
ncbi:hypothetical protein SAMD00019534_048990 [Acytostelium subglobosum LB1]|uniref:hypothetical protein n=1 Tax=Acytostelium subglobosum LB1 TaxID=1410327 RepID=UPI000645054B|nr:hypothetical protein SAMD00019534_048990 [Acytostelium subglobosum LB1]GAM21724.1 hypothetical protein SAMD00019534_048990 [Acytostelium subglobosum LB1]|eukprot:XP_012754824.1 hypothetical protein SAMD00019534_048990 [Acytostelium subglobosum LB1]